MLDVLVYLFETYMSRESDVLTDQDELADALTQAGFYREDIYDAFNWLEALADLQDGETAPYFYETYPLALRVYTEEESRRLGIDCRGFILFLEQIQVLNFLTREMVIDRVMALDVKQLNQEELKWVVLMVLFNIPGYEDSYQQMEGLLFEINDGYLH